MSNLEVPGPTSESLFERARGVIPGGVNSPVRAFKAIGGAPVFVKAGRGPIVLDAEGRELLDYVGSWGPLLLGHAHPAILEAISGQLARGTTFGMPTEQEVELGELIKKALPSCERVRLVSSGTEACMSALRLARAHTGRDAIVKLEGCYHGHADSLLVKAGSGAATFGVPSSAGVPADLAKHTLTARYGDLEDLERCLDAAPCAAVIVEPYAGNMGVVVPSPAYLRGVRDLTKKKGALLIFDEVMTGFRVAWGGVQTIEKIVPDLTCLGKVVGGGLPLAAFGGSEAIMSKLAPLGPCYQAGTLSGNPLAVAAGLAQLRELERLPDAYARLERHGKMLEEGLVRALAKSGVKGVVQRAGSMITLFFTDRPVRSWDDAATCDTALFARFFKEMLARRIHLPPSQFEAWFLSLAHGDGHIERTIAAAEASLAVAKG